MGIMAQAHFITCPIVSQVSGRSLAAISEPIWQKGLPRD